MKQNIVLFMLGIPAVAVVVGCQGEPMTNWQRGTAHDIVFTATAPDVRSDLYGYHITLLSGDEYYCEIIDWRRFSDCCGVVESPEGVFTLPWIVRSDIEPGDDYRVQITVIDTNRQVSRSISGKRLTIS